MRISSNSRYKSLPVLPEIHLPDFVVLVGVNGAGKSHLLQVLSNTQLTSITDDNGQQLAIRKLVETNTLAPNNSPVVSWDNLKQSPINATNLFTGYKQNKQNNPNFRFANQTGDPRQHRLFNVIARAAKKSLDELTPEDIYEHYPMNDGLETVDVFAQNFSQLFKRYQVRKLDNEFNEWRHQRDATVKYLSESDFLLKFGEAPWDFVNKILKEAKLDYHINSPVNQDRDAPFELKLMNETNGAEVIFSDLSGGEKVLMSLALSLYNSNFDMEFPQVLLMDEPDSPLHPSMTKQFLEVLENVFVRDKKVKVIVTTHSPSTVALAPESSLFQMSKAEPRILKVTKDKAIGILTSGVPSLSINYENRRQVFVESKNDVYFYEKIYQKLKNYLHDEISINFISSGVNGQGNSDQVRTVVNKLSEYGNKTVYGVIDWDAKNSSTSYMKVLGEDNRYSIENYIFDPLVLAAFLLRDKIILRDLVGLNDRENYTDFVHFDAAKLQVITNAIVSQIQSVAGHGLDETAITTQLINGKQIAVPSWYLRFQGHELESLIKRKFPELNQYRVEGELKKKIIDTVVDDLPPILSTDFVDLFRSIQNTF